MSRTALYASVSDLAHDVAAVALVTIVPGTMTTVPADEAGRSMITADLAVGRVQQVLQGELPAELPIRLLTSESKDSEVPPPLAEGHRYVMFLNQFEWSPGKPTCEWTVPGGAGIYQVDDAGRLALVSRGEDDLPPQFSSVAALVEAMQSEPDR